MRNRDKDSIDRIIGRLGRQLSDEMLGSEGLKVCVKTEGIKRHTRRKAVVYCGIEHQKADQKTHKKEDLSAVGAEYIPVHICVIQHSYL